MCKITLKVKRPIAKAFPKQLKTIGDHMRKRRLELNLMQAQVALQLGVTKSSIYNWERATKPGIRFFPSILAFLGYDPFPSANGWAERLVQSRTVLGMSQRQAAKEIGVDQTTLARWERGEREPSGKFARLATRFVATERNKYTYRTGGK